MYQVTRTTTTAVADLEGAAPPLPFFGRRADRSTVRRALQNTQNDFDGGRWLSRSFKIECTKFVFARTTLGELTALPQTSQLV